MSFDRARGETYSNYRKRISTIHQDVYGEKPTHRRVNNRIQPLNKAELNEIANRLKNDLAGIDNYQRYREETLRKYATMFEMRPDRINIHVLKSMNDEMDDMIRRGQQGIHRNIETLKSEEGGWAAKFILAINVRGQWEEAKLPTRSEILLSIESSIGELTGQNGLFSYSGMRSDGMYQPPVSIFDGARMDHDVLDKIYGLLVRLSTDYNYNFVTVVIRWVPLDFNYDGGFAVFQSKNPLQNCAIKLMCNRFKSVKNNIEKIKLNDDGGFGIDQMNQLAKIIRKNIIMCNLLGTEILRSNTNYKANVSFHDVDRHAYNHIAPYPFEIHEVKLMDDINYNLIKNLYGDQDYMIYSCNEGFILTNESKSIAIRRTDIFNPIEKRAKELDIKNYATLKSPFSVEFRKFKEINDIKNTNFAIDLWRQANLNTSPYSSFTTKKTYTVDMNSAYESFKTCELYEQYGFPHHDNNHAFSNPPIEVLNETGLVVLNVDVQKCHPWVQHRINYQDKVVLPTPLAKFWGDRLVIKSIELAVIAPKYMCELQRPDRARYRTDGTRSWEYPHENTYKNSKGWFREAVGRLIPNESKVQKLYIRNHSEAIDIIKEARKNGNLKTYEYKRLNSIQNEIEKSFSTQLSLQDNYIKSNFAGSLQEYQAELDKIDGYYIISLSNDELNGAYHIHSFVLAYSHILIDKEVFAHPFNKVHKVLVDSITLSEPPSEYVTNNIAHEVIGSWKWEAFKYYEYAPPIARSVNIDVQEIGVYDKLLASSEPKLNIIHGPPGFGKSHLCLNMIRGHKHIILTPTRKMAKKFKSEGFSALTLKYALNPYGDFDPLTMRLPKNVIIYIPEIGFWQLEQCKEVIEYLLKNRYTIIADGDKHQMNPVNGTSPWNYFDENHNIIEIDQTNSKDYRSKDDETREFKMKIRGLTNSEILSMIPNEKIQYLLDNWRPSDFIYTTRNEIIDYLHEKLQKVYEQKFAGTPKRYIYTSKSPLSGEEVYVLEEPENAKLAWVQTFNSCQGDTCPIDQMVYLISDKATEFFLNAIYVGATRIQLLSQLKAISLKEWA